MCFATAEMKPIRFQWMKNNNLLSEEKHIRTEGGTSHSVLVFDTIQMSDTGNYTCLASTTSGQDSYSAQLLVKGISGKILYLFLNVV